MAGGQQPRAVEVKCYAGYRGEEAPRSFLLDGKELAVAEIVERWQTPQGRYFRVRTEEGVLYDLCHVEQEERWQLMAMDQSGSP